MTPRPGSGFRRRSGLPAVLALLMLVPAGCRTEPSIPLDRPDGWLTDDRGSWWLPGVDTAIAFRDLSGFEAMGLTRDAPVYSAERTGESRLAVGRYRLLEAVREDLLPLYRNRPDVVDSLFWKYAADDILPPSGTGEVGGLVERYRREAYRTIMRHFRAPAALVTLGRDIPVPVPDSLRATSAGRSVSFQIYVDDAGRPVGIRQLEGVHPVLDRIALRAVTRVTWQPAYVLRGSRSRPIDAWVRFGVRFPGAPSGDGTA